MKYARNIAAGVASSVWTGVVQLAAIPLFVHYLGIDSYGLVGFYATTQVLLQLLDMGLAPTVNRELARHSAADRIVEARALLYTLGLVYLGTAMLIGLTGFLLAPFIASHWLNSETIPAATLTQAVTLMALVVACRWPLGLYQGALMGMQRLNVSSAVNAVMLTVQNVGAVGVLAFVSPTIQAFFIWQACATLSHVLVMRAMAVRVVGRDEVRRFDMPALRGIWRFSAGMTGIAISSVVLTQMDKVVLSKLLSLGELGKYTLAGVFASGLYVFLQPVFHVIYPRMSQLVETGEQGRLMDIYRNGARALNSVLLPVAISASLYSGDVLFFWTGNPALAAGVAPIASLLVLGTACNGIMHFPYALQLASGTTRLPFTITTTLACLLGPLIVSLTLSHGTIGSAAAWLIVNVTYVFFGTWLTHRQLLKGIAASWLARDVGIPLLLTVVVEAVAWRYLRVDGSHARNLALGVGAGLLAILVNFLSMPAAALAQLRPARSVQP